MKRTTEVIALVSAAVLMAASATLFAVDPAPPTTAKAPPATTAAPAKATAPTPAEVLVEKAKELLRQGKLGAAKEANDKALALEPDLQAARVMDQYLAGKIAEAAANSGNNGGAKTPATGAGAEKAGLLSNEQISRIRLFEASDKDRIQGLIDRKTLDEFWKEVVLKDPLETNKTQNDYNLFMAATSFPLQARKVRDSNNAKYIEKVSVTTDPQSMLVFRNSIHPYVLNNCANTAGCHGQENPKSTFRLVNRGGNPTSNAYTNFYVMTQTKVGGARMIDRDAPEESLFMQYGLPKEQAKQSHPGKAVLAQRFRGTDDKLFRDMAAWVGTLVRIEPDYGIQFSPATAPAPK